MDRGAQGPRVGRRRFRLFMASKELQAIVAARERARAQGRRAALVTVIKTSGSTYRRPGARMLVLEGSDGTADTIGADFLGSISGGCLEDDAREHALAAIASGRPVVIHYDTTAESDILFGTGAGCQGIVHAFIEPLPLSDTAADPLACIARNLSERRAGALASVIAVEPSDAAPAPGSFLWVNAPRSGPLPPPVTTITDPVLTAAIARDARMATSRGQGEVRCYPLPGGGRAEVFIDVVRPSRSLLICGAGQDAVPLARLGKELGWRVRVVDGRRAYITRERFPDVDELIHCPAPDFATRVTVEPGEAAVVMTHNYIHDRDILRALIPSPAGYIGMLGPRARTERLLGDLASAADDGQPLDMGKFSLGRLHGPAGLDIGAEAPEQIALAIVAEIEAATAGREGGMLKRRASNLHGRSDTAA